jgi:hypothetical protein
MPVLANTHCNDRDLICASFLPFARPDYIEGMVIGDDLDSLLSAMYLHQKFGWQVAGVYCRYTRLWHTGTADAFREKLYSGKLFAVDLDIYHAAIPSLGHHIIALSGDEILPGHSHSLNPNALRGFSIERGFRRKYPLATAHFLYWLFDEQHLSPETHLLIWLADSAFINAQHYRDNVVEWVQEFMPHPAFVRALPVLNTPDFEQRLSEKILRPLSSNPLCKPSRSKYQSVHNGINGYQCQFEDPNRQNRDLQNLLEILAHLSGLPALPFPVRFDGCLTGKRHEQAVADIGAPFDEWLERFGVFSYAFTYKDRLNYTVL